MAKELKFLTMWSWLRVIFLGLIIRLLKEKKPFREKLSIPMSKFIKTAQCSKLLIVMLTVDFIQINEFCVSVAVTQQKTLFYRKVSSRFGNFST